MNSLNKLAALSEQDDKSACRREIKSIYNQPLEPVKPVQHRQTFHLLISTFPQLWAKESFFFFPSTFESDGNSFSPVRNDPSASRALLRSPGRSLSLLCRHRACCLWGNCRKIYSRRWRQQEQSPPAASGGKGGSLKQKRSWLPPALLSDCVTELQRRPEVVRLFPCRTIKHLKTCPN